MPAIRIAIEDINVDSRQYAECVVHAHKEFESRSDKWANCCKARKGRAAV